MVCQDVRYSYRKGFTLGPLSVSLGTGVTCLVGANGAGKTTLFGLLAGLAEPQHGSVDVNPGRSIGFLPQAPELPGHATCAQFLHHVAWLQGVPSSDRGTAVADALRRADLVEQAKARIKTLSGGMQRRLGIAQAMVHDPAVVLLDEPTAGLDPVQRLAARSMLTSSATNRVVIVSTHLVEDVRGLADRILLLVDGGLAFDGTVNELEGLASPDAPGETDLERAMSTLIVGPA